MSNLLILILSQHPAIAKRNRTLLKILSRGQYGFPALSTTETIYEDGKTVRHEKLIVHQESAHAVAAARAIVGISQKQLAERSGIDQSDISKIERGIANPSVATLDRIAKALGGRLAISIEIPATAL